MLAYDNGFISKSELKKRKKLRENEEKKREKAATTLPTIEKKPKSAEEEESNLTPNVRQFMDIVGIEHSNILLSIIISNTTKSGVQR